MVQIPFDSVTCCRCGKKGLHEECSYTISKQALPEHRVRAGANTEDTETTVCEDIKRRQRLGVEKYKTTVADNPLSLREWLQHAYEECLDQAVYLRRAIQELDHEQHSPGPLQIEAGKWYERRDGIVVHVRLRENYRGAWPYTSADGITYRTCGLSGFPESQNSSDLIREVPEPG